MISALHTVRPLTVTRIFEVVLRELNDMQRYVDRAASVSGSMNTPAPAAPRYPARKMRAVQADEASHSDSDPSGDGKVTPKSVPKSHTPLSIQVECRKREGWKGHEQLVPRESCVPASSPLWTLCVGIARRQVTCNGSVLNPGVLFCVCVSTRRATSLVSVLKPPCRIQGR